MPNRRNLLKSCAIGTSLIGYSGLAAATEEKQLTDVVHTSQPTSSLNDCTTEILADNEEFRDIYASCGDESVEVRYYKETEEVVFITTPDEPNKIKGRELTTHSIPLPDPPALVDSWEPREEVVHSNCDVVGISDHHFAGMDIELTRDGTQLSAALIAAVICGLPTLNWVLGIVCGIGAAVFDWLILAGYGIEGEATIGLMDVDEGQYIYTEQTGLVHVDVPSIAVVGYPQAGASTDELEFFQLISDLSGFDLPQVEPVHMEPLLDEL